MALPTAAGAAGRLSVLALMAAAVASLASTVDASISASVAPLAPALVKVRTGLAHTAAGTASTLVLTVPMVSLITLSPCVPLTKLGPPSWPMMVVAMLALSAVAWLPSLMKKPELLPFTRSSALAPLASCTTWQVKMTDALDASVKYMLIGLPVGMMTFCAWLL